MRDESMPGPDDPGEPTGPAAGERWGVGVTIGKFNPPHLGHAFLVERAAERVERLFVILCARADQTLTGEARARWLRESAPGNVSVLVTPDDLPEENEPWAQRTLALLPEPPRIAFTSERYGEGWAAAMGAAHYPIDPGRERVPITGTELRRDLRAGFDFLVPAARAALAKRVLVVGAESTGKSTLAESLAKELETVWVPELGRLYWVGRRHRPDPSWRPDELRFIAETQRRLEDQLARSARNGVLVADTDALTTSVWARRYLGGADPVLEKLSAAAVPDLYLVCAPDFPWVQDGTRESREERDWMHDMTLELVERTGAPREILTGPHPQRLARALHRIEALTDFPPLV